MSVRLRLVLVVIAALLPALGVWRWVLAVERPDATGLTPALPAQLGPWTVTREERLGDDVLRIIQPLSHVVRLYEAPGRAPIWIYVGVYAGRAGHGAGAHDPKVCYPAQGWEVLDTRSARVSIEGESVPVTALDAHLGRRKEAVLYWFQPAGRWPHQGAAEQILRMFDAVRGRPQYAFVRLSAAVEPEYDADRDLAEFAERMAPAVRGEIERLL